jgi:hypothetical protein
VRWFGVIVLVAACHHTSSNGSDGRTGDGRGGDAKSGHNVGDPCQHDQDCNVLVFGAPAGVCLVQSPFTNGYCSANIGECPAGSGAPLPCPMGTTCIAPGIPATQGQDYCVKNCASNADCRASDGYTCCPKVEGISGPFCYPSALCR